MLALTVYLQNTWARLKERQEGQTMAEYALILGLIAIFVMIAVFFLGGKIKDLFENTGLGRERAERARLVGARTVGRRPAGQLQSPSRAAASRYLWLASAPGTSWA